MFYNANRLKQSNWIMYPQFAYAEPMTILHWDYPSTVRGQPTDRRNSACVVGILRCFLFCFHASRMPCAVAWQIHNMMRFHWCFRVKTLSLSSGWERNRWRIFAKPLAKEGCPHATLLLLYRASGFSMVGFREMFSWVFPLPKITEEVALREASIAFVLPQRPLVRVNPHTPTDLPHDLNF